MNSVHKNSHSSTSSCPAVFFVDLKTDPKQCEKRAQLHDLGVCLDVFIPNSSESVSNLIQPCEWHGVCLQKIAHPLICDRKFAATPLSFEFHILGCEAESEGG